MKILKNSNEKQELKLNGQLDVYTEKNMPFGCSACEDGECGFCETNGD